MSYKPITTEVPTNVLTTDLLTQMIEILNPLFIFLGDFTTNPIIKTLTIIVDENQYNPKLFEKANSILENHQHLKQRISSETYAQEQIKEGNLFFIENLLLGNMIYKNPEIDFSFMTSALCLNDLIGRSKRNFNKEMKKIDAFNEGAFTFYERGNYALSTFTYHQTMELLYRTAECALMGKNKITHRLREHQEFCTGFIPALATFFNPNDDDEIAVLKLLDESYCAARYQSDFEPTVEEIDILYYKAEQLFTLVKSLFEFTWQRCFVESYKKDKTDEADEKNQEVLPIKIHIPIVTEMEAKQEAMPPEQTETPAPLSGNYETEDKLLVQVIELIKTKISIDSVFLISKYQDQQTMEIHLEQATPLLQNIITYTLMLVTKEPSTLNPSELLNFIFQETDGSCKVYSVFFTVGEIITKRNYGSHFLEHIIMESKWAYYEKEKDLDSSCAVSYYPKIVNKIERIWNKKYGQATHLMDFLEVTELKYEDPRINLAILKLALEQTCLGMIQVFWEFKPKEYSLPYLLHICTHFSKTPANIFPKTTYDNQRMYHLICNAQNILRSNKNPQVNNKDSESAIAIGEEFIRKAQEEVSNHLKHLHNLSEEYVKARNN